MGSPYQKEFQDWLQKVHDISKTDLSVGGKRKALSDNLDELGKDAFDVYFPQIMDIVQKSKEKCQPFKNSEEQVDNILSWLPRLKDNRELALLFIQERRKKYKLTV